MRIGCKAHAERLLKWTGCSLDCYRGMDIAVIENDLVQYYSDHPNEYSYPIHDVALCLREIGDEQPIIEKPKKIWKVIWDGDSFIDGLECESFEQAKNDALDTLWNWKIEQLDEMDVSSFDNWSEKQIEDWDYMIYNCGSWVEKLNEETGEWEECWHMTDEEANEMFWLPYDEIRKAIERGE